MIGIVKLVTSVHDVLQVYLTTRCKGQDHERDEVKKYMKYIYLGSLIDAFSGA